MVSGVLIRNIKKLMPPINGHYKAKLITWHVWGAILARVESGALSMLEASVRER